jgi:hypothetical protein
MKDVLKPDFLDSEVGLFVLKSTHFYISWYISDRGRSSHPFEAQYDVKHSKI